MKEYLENLKTEHETFLKEANVILLGINRGMDLALGSCFQRFFGARWNNQI